MSNIKYYLNVLRSKPSSEISLLLGKHINTLNFVQMFKCLNVKMREKGVSLYLALMVMFILLAVGLGISLIIVSQMKMIREMGDSVIAFYAADTGIENALYDKRKEVPPGSGIVSGTVGGANYSVTYLSPNKWRSVGESLKGVKRAIEINTLASPPGSGLTYTQSCQGDCGTAPCNSAGLSCNPLYPYVSCSKGTGACSGSKSCPAEKQNSTLISNTCSCKADGTVCALECVGSFCPDSTFCYLRGTCTYQCNIVDGVQYFWNGTECVPPT